jgi:thioredoxin-related protein
MACTQMKPVVDRIEEELGDRIMVIRLDVQTQAGRELARGYGFRYTPTFIMFDAQGREIWRQVGGLDTERVRASVE